MEVAADSSEITVILELLYMFELSGCIAPIDAIGCQKSIAQLITERGTDSLLALKQNQPQLHGNVSTIFKLERESEFAQVPPTTTRRLKRSMVASKPGTDAKLLLAAARAHWGIENSVHYLLDVVLREDDNRIRQGPAQHNLSPSALLGPQPLTQ